jgi:transcriptional regulator with XRE-family HTH domain
MNTVDLFAATGTTSTAESAGLPLWPHLNVTGTVIQVPQAECDLAGMDASPVPEAVHLAKRIQDGLGITIGQLAMALGCSRQAVHGWKRGRRIDAGNLANLRTLAEWADEWAMRHPDREIEPDLLGPAFLEKLARAGISSPKGRAMWEKRILGPDPTSGWEPLTSADNLARLIGAKPLSDAERAHWRAHNLGSLKIDARL